MSAVGVGVVGAGTLSGADLEHMTSFPDLDVRFVADLVPERAAEQAAKHGVEGSGTVEELLARDDVESVVNLTIPGAHYEGGAAALAPGLAAARGVAEQHGDRDQRQADAADGRAERAGRTPDPEPAKGQVRPEQLRRRGRGEQPELGRNAAKVPCGGTSPRWRG